MNKRIAAAVALASSLLLGPAALAAAEPASTPGLELESAGDHVLDHGQGDECHDHGKDDHDHDGDGKPDHDPEDHDDDCEERDPKDDD